MSKAYDSVNIHLLDKALQRIHMPICLVNIIINLLRNRSNQVITNFGPSPSYEVQDGIDQGETITPLLWRIYYDPLINNINKKHTGYTLTTEWISQLNSIKYQSTTTSTSTLAYMDDTLWLAKSKEQLQEIVQTASTFYTMTHIKVNPHKSTLVSNTKLTPTIHFMNSTIQTLPCHTPFKFLGCWFTATSKYATQIKLIKQEALGLNEILKTKNITDKQAAYIISIVIISTLEYHIHNIVLS